MEKDISVKKNTIYNIIKSVSAIVFPMITFPYASRVLGVENVGKINFSSSMISYISLIASLGVTTYAVRECAKVREDREQLNRLSSQIFSINIISTIFAYIVLFICLLFFKPLFDYRLLIVIQGISVLLTTLGTDWINSAMEDFRYITIRTFIFQIISIILMVIFVREPSHYYRYALIVVLSASGGNIMNFFYRKKYCNISITCKMNIKKHLKPIIMVFSLILSQTIYCNSDMTILGLMKGDYQVGLYSVAVKIYTIVNTMVASVAMVVMPRMANWFAKKNYEEINKLIRYAVDCIVTLGLPVAVGVACIAPELVEIIAGVGYMGADFALRILMISLVFSYLGGIITNIIMIPSGREKVSLKASIVSASINIVLNIILIPRYGLYAAAFTTALAEFVALCIVSRYVEKDIKIGRFTEIFGAPIIGCIGISIITIFIKQLPIGLWGRTCIIIGLSMLTYIITLIIMKNKFALEIINSVKNKKKNRKEI